MYNWNTLNQKVFRKLGFQLSKQDCQDIANAVPGAIERVLKLARIRLASYTGGDLDRCVAASQMLIGTTGAQLRGCNTHCLLQ
jgi:hypothetical protein